ncbi:MAG TPA: ABC-F family ATP-binding cassette domain-containing protein [Beijerinckiaceae bacterium]|jgi:ATPase subunit of ABC transporter with duplicated ATPase domains|nr:ABC-F family ATP-binding cassette domain-containing protein [Beijerinckiaceae bacterium]
MPASISLSQLTLCAPDGRSLLADLDLRFGSERTGLVGRNGIGKTTLLAVIAGEAAPRSGTVSVNGTLGLFRQTVQTNADEALVDVFGARQALALLRRAERGEATVDELAEADWTLGARIEAALARVGLDMSPETPLTKLSGGQSTRAGLAALIFTEPDFLLLDEPTNNLDRVGRQALYEWLSGWRAGAIVVSHDRELLDIMDCIVELTSLGATRYGGNWRFYREQTALQLAAAQHDLAEAEKRAADIERKAQVAVERQARRDGAGRKKGAKGGTPRIVLGGLKERSENSGGSDARLADARRSQAAEAVAGARERLEVLQPLSVVLPSTGLPNGREVLRLEAVAAGYLLGHPVIRGLSFAITGPERVAITGPNGSGKSTLLALVTGQLTPQAGTVQVMSAFAMLDQRVSLLDSSASIRDNFRRLNPQADENACRAALARFMFRAGAALQRVDALSGGQVLRAGLACVLGGAKPPPLLILDEPTNHLDIDSLEAIEAGLRAYDGALLVVSHDEAFLAAIGVTRRVELTATKPR